MKSLFGSGEGKYTLPPFPHPLPERSLSLHCTKDGLYIVPARPSQKTPAPSSTTFRQRHLPRTSILSTTEDVARDVKLTKRSTTSAKEGARIGWGRAGNVKPASQEAIRRALDESPGEEILCYGVLGIQRLFNGEQGYWRCGEDSSLT
jgi:hypothetical protein